MVRVEAVIPAFSPTAEQIRGAVASSTASGLVGRVLVVDDGSEPPLRLEGEPNVVVVRQANAGPSAARNRGLDLVHADFAVLLDQDDLLLAEGLEAMVSLADRTGAGAVIAARYEERSGERRLKVVPPEWTDRPLPSPGDVFRPVAFFGGSGVLVRMEVVRRGVRFDEDLWIGEDRDFLRRVVELAPIAVCSTPALVVRLHDGGDNLSSLKRLRRRVRDHVRILEKHRDAPSQEPLRAQTLWLLSALSKQRPLDRESWEELETAARARGWSIPLKSRLRAWRGRAVARA